MGSVRGWLSVGGLATNHSNRKKYPTIAKNTFHAHPEQKYTNTHTHKNYQNNEKNTFVYCFFVVGGRTNENNTRYNYF